ncbi:MAG: 30S ribosomal protein S9 [Solirubrobacterales bacterium]|nr:30S ribosomal protein S9 [Solirubrobacterales bacterium]
MSPDDAAPEPASEEPEEAAPAETDADETGGSEPVAEPATAAESDAPDADETGGSEPSAAPTPEASEEPAEAPKAASPPERKQDVVPGADLEPIAIGEERELSAEERARAEADEEERAAREARAAAAEEDDEAVTPRAVSVPADAQIQATGKRKSAVARVIVRAGDGGFHVNDRTLEEYFPSTLHQAQARQALVTSGYEGNVDVRVRVHGGGISGQAGAVRHGVARALTTLEPELRGDLKRRGMLTRDDRRKERKKAGLKKARKRPQFSKR